MKCSENKCLFGHTDSQARARQTIGAPGPSAGPARPQFLPQPQLRDCGLGIEPSKTEHSVGSIPTAEAHHWNAGSGECGHQLE